MKVLVTGATGMIGSAVCHALHARGDQVVGLSRNPAKAREAAPYITWHAWQSGRQDAPAAAFEAVEGVLNLVGEPLNQRWTQAAKTRIHESRVASTESLVRAILASNPRPRVLISGSAVGYYGDRGSVTVDESAGPGTSFDARLCAAWEQAAREVENDQQGPPVRLVIVRSGPVLSPAGGMLSELLLPFKLGLGGPIAGGENYISWISLADEVQLLLWVLDTESARGVYNGTAPEPVSNRELSKALGRELGRPAVIPVPKLVLQVRFGTELADTLTGGVRALPKRAREHGFEFEHQTIAAALADELGG